MFRRMVSWGGFLSRVGAAFEAWRWKAVLMLSGESKQTRQWAVWRQGERGLDRGRLERGW